MISCVLINCVAGADIKEMAPKDLQVVYKEDFIKPWTRLADTRLPVIAAVNGYAVCYLQFLFHFYKTGHCLH